MRTFRFLRVAGGVSILALALLASGGVRTAGSSVEQFRIRDDCDPATFNAAIRPGTCVGDGDTTFGDFIAQLVDHQFAGAWRFQPDKTELDVGTTIVAKNRGGETHTFTKVANFGGGFVGILNGLSGNTTLAPECAGTLTNGALVPGTGALASFVGPGATSGSTTVSSGTQRFQCCIHPWMRSTVTGE